MRIFRDGGFFADEDKKQRKRTAVVKLEYRRKNFGFLPCLFPLILIAGWLCPINSTAIRCLILLGLVGTCAEIVLVFCRIRRKNRKIFHVGIALTSMVLFLIFVLMFLWPQRESGIGEEYLSSLKSYEETPYLWGGENRLGIDCSGLPRKAMRTALLRTAWNTGSVSLYFAALENWWFDASAKALMEGYRNYLVPLDLSGTVETAPESELRDGDLAITDDGVHVLVFLGRGEWISADPGQGKVVIEHSSGSKNPWFQRPVHFYRWTSLDGMCGV